MTRPRRSVLVMPLATALSCAACATERGDAGQATPVVRDSAGVTIVESPGPGGPRLEVTEARRIGRVDGDAPYLFTRVVDVAVTPADTVYVANGQTRTVRVFDPSGRFVRAFGGRGEGPAELAYLDAMWLAGDTAVLLDHQMQGRMALFHASGTFLASWDGVSADGERFIVTARGPRGWLARVYDSPPAGGFTLGDSIIQRVRILPYDPLADVLGPAVVVAPGRALYGVRSTMHGTGSRVEPDWPLFRAQGSAFDAAGRFHRTGAGYEVLVHDPDGRLERIVRRRHEPRPIGEREVDAYRRGALGAMRTLYGDVPDIDRQIRSLEGRIEAQAALPIPATMPPIRDLLVSADGTLWVESLARADPAEVEIRNLFGTGPGGWPIPASEWDVFDGSGALLGTVGLPARFRPFAVRGTEITGVLPDDLDVEYVVTFQATRSSR